jgi:hypothetical protein
MIPSESRITPHICTKDRHNTVAHAIAMDAEVTEDAILCPFTEYKKTRPRCSTHPERDCGVQHI